MFSTRCVAQAAQAIRILPSSSDLIRVRQANSDRLARAFQWSSSRDGAHARNLRRHDLRSHEPCLNGNGARGPCAGR